MNKIIKKIIKKTFGTKQGPPSLIEAIVDHNPLTQTLINEGFVKGAYVDSSSIFLRNVELSIDVLVWERIRTAIFNGAEYDSKLYFHVDDNGNMKCSDFYESFWRNSNKAPDNLSTQEFMKFLKIKKIINKAWQR